MPVQFAFCKAGISSGRSEFMVPVASTVSSENITSSASNQQTTLTAPAGDALCRVSTDTAVYVAFGANPNALTSTAARFHMPAGAVEYFRVNVGDKAAVVNV
jgi:precorrin isomerase